MFRRPTKEINAEFPAEEKHIDSIQRVVREACASAGLKRKEISQVLIAIEEGATNIIRHAYLYESGMLRLRIIIYKRLISFSLIDRGRSFKPDGSGKLDLDKLVESGRRGGLGFYMIQKIMDTVDYVSWAGQNELRMTKRRAGVSDTPPFLRRVMTLRFKFSIWNFIIVGLIVGGTFYFINDRSIKDVYRYFDGTARALGKTIAKQSALYILNDRSDVEFDELVVSYQISIPMIIRIVLTDSSGFIIARSDANQNIHTKYINPDWVGFVDDEEPRRTIKDGVEINYIFQTIRSGETFLGKAYIFYSSSPANAMLREARIPILKFTSLLMLIGIIGIYLLSNYFVKPIVDITRRVRRFSSGDLQSELPLVGAAEFFEISNALNEMMTRLRNDRETLVEREKLAKEVEVASQIQKTLLPRKIPELNGLDIEPFYRAASVIGGDLYDIFRIDENRCGLLVADVSGKGVPASLIMSVLRTVIQIYSSDSDSPRSTLLLVNRYMSTKMPRGMFITVLMAVYNSKTKIMSIVSAGHNPMLLFRKKTGKIRKLNPSGMPLGLSVEPLDKFDKAIKEIEFKLDENDCFLMYTDGITDSENRNGEQYGLNRLNEFLTKHWKNDKQTDLKELSDKLISEIDDYAGFSSQRDDITFILGRTIVDKQKTIPEDIGEEKAIEQRELPGD